MHKDEKEDSSEHVANATALHRRDAKSFFLSGSCEEKQTPRTVEKLAAVAPQLAVHELVFFVLRGQAEYTRAATHVARRQCQNTRNEKGAQGLHGGR